MAKYRVETTGGVYEVETADSTQQAPQEQGMFGKTMDVLGTPGRGVAALAYGAGQLAPLVVGQSPHRPVDQVVSRMSDMTQPGFQPQNIDEQSADVSGMLTNAAIPVGSALQGLKASKLGTIAKGLVSSTSKLGKGIADTEKAVGLVTDKVVTIPRGAGLTKVLQDIKDTGDLVKSGLKQDTPQFAQQLKDYYDKASGILDQGQKVIGKKNYALASEAKAAISDALNAAVPGREAAQLASRTAYIRNNAAGLGIVGLAANKVKNVITGALGGQ